MEIFILQSKRNKTEGEIAAEREEIIDAVKKAYPDKNVKFVESSIKGAMIKASPLWGMGQLLQRLSAIDLVVFSHDAICERECRISQVCCEEYDIPFAHYVDSQLITQ